MTARRVHLRRVLHVVALAVGAISFWLVSRDLGWSGLRRVLVGTGAWFAVIAVVDVLSVTMDAAAIRSFLQREVTLPLHRVLAAQWSGLAINRLTPGNSLGEPIKVSILSELVPTSLALSAIVMFNLATYGVAVITIVIGAPLTLLVMDLSTRERWVVVIAALVLLALVTMMIMWARRGAAQMVVRTLRRIRVISQPRSERWAEVARTVDQHVRDLLRTGKRGIGFVACSRMLNWTGTLLVMHAAQIPLTAPLVIAMLSIGILVNWISNIIPLGIGIADSTNYALYNVLGSSGPAGVLFTMVNRTRTCVLALLGLLVMSGRALRRR